MSEETAVIERVQRQCPGCGADHARKLDKLSHPDWATVICEDCGFVYLNEAPVYEALSEDLAWTKQFKKEKKRRTAKQPIIAWLDEKTRWRLHMARDDEWAYITDKLSSGNVLDVGCGQASRVPPQFVPFGIEIEKVSAELAHAEMSAKGGKVIHAPALEGLSQFDANMFDGIIMRSYLEHEAQPREVLEESLRVLKPGGVIYVKVPNFGTLNRMVRGRDWCGFRFPDHLNYFTISSLKAMALQTGYQFELRNKLTQITNDNMHCFLTKPS